MRLRSSFPGLRNQYGGGEAQNAFFVAAEILEEKNLVGKFVALKKLFVLKSKHETLSKNPFDNKNLLQLKYAQQILINKHSFSKNIPK